MRFTLDLPEGTCQRLALRAGAEIACTAGTVWLTLEDGRRDGPPSPDIVLGAGERHHLADDADCFLHGLKQGETAACAIDLSRERATIRWWQVLIRRLSSKAGIRAVRRPAWRRAFGSA